MFTSFLHFVALLFWSISTFTESDAKNWWEKGGGGGAPDFELFQIL